MFFDPSEKLLFIACPKTGSTSVEAALKERFPDGTCFRIDYMGRRYTSADVRSPSLGHAKAREFRRLLGDLEYEKFYSFAFVRNPIEKAISAYFFTRQGRLREAFAIRTEKIKAVMVIKRIAQILLARALPLGIWVLIYPRKSTHDYVTDESGNLIVRFLGSTERLAEDTAEILRLSGIESGGVTVGQTNLSQHKGVDDYPSIRLVKPILKSRFKADLKLMELVAGGVFTVPRQGRTGYGP